MSVPKSVTRYSKKNGLTFISNVDQVNYTLNELSRAALRDVGALVIRETKRNIKRRTGKLAKNTQKWVRKKDADLQIGFKPGGFYGMYQEFGSAKTPKIAALYNAVNDNIPQIITIESKYLSALSGEAATLSMIDESEVNGE